MDKDSNAATTAHPGTAAAPPDGLICFGAFQLDVANALLCNGGRPVALPPKPFAVLCFLALRPGQLVTKAALLDAVWGDRFVSESVVKSSINLIRAALGDDPQQARVLQTVARRGYRFVALPAVAAMATHTTAAEATLATTRAQPELDARVEPPLVGRGPALQQLSQSLDAAAAGQQQLVLVVGEAGMGKSCLLRALARQAGAPLSTAAPIQPLADPPPARFTVALGQCVEQAGGGEPYLPVLEALEELLGSADGELWLAALRQTAPTWLAQLPWRVAAADQAALQRELAGAAQDRMLREFGALLDRATPTRPLLLLLEDLHWSDQATVSLLGYLARRRGPARWMLVASFRPPDLSVDDSPLQALRRELQLHQLCQELVLQPFTASEVDRYVLQRLGTGWQRQRERLAGALHRHTDGLPLFLAHVLDNLLAENLLDGWPKALAHELVDEFAHDLAADPAASAPGGPHGQAPGGRLGPWSDPDAELARLQLPHSVVGMVERQIQAMPDDLRRVLEAAAAVGQEFNHLLLARVMGQPGPRVQQLADQLVRLATWLCASGLVAFPDGALGSRYSFRHALYRRVFYERLAPAHRVHLHLQAAEAIQALHGDAADRYAAELAHHFEAARDTAAASGAVLTDAARQALTWRLRAARAAATVHAPADALAHLALARFDVADAAEQVAVLCERAALHQRLGDGTAALSQSVAALALARTLAQPAPSQNTTLQNTTLQNMNLHNTILQNTILQRAMLQNAQLSQLNDNPTEAISRADELLASLPGPGAELQADAQLVKSDALECLGRRIEADAAAAAAWACLPADDQAARAKHLASRVAALFHRGKFAEGLPLIEDAFQRYEAAGDALGAAAMRNVRGVFAMSLGQLIDAEQAMQDARTRTRAISDVPGQRRAILNLVKLRTDRGEAKPALALLNEGWQLSPSFESPVAECAFLSGFYYCHYLHGELGLALRDAERVLASAAALSSVYWRVGSLCLVSDLHIHLGDLDGASRLIDQAMAQGNAHEVNHHRPQVMGRRAWLDVLSGHSDLALQRLDALDGAGVSQVEDQAALARVRAQAWLAKDQPQKALQALATFDGAPTQEVWTLILALRLRAQHLTGSISARDVQRAQVELQDSRNPPLESLLLRQALATALQTQGEAGLAQAHRALQWQQVQALAGTLGDWPAQLIAFRLAWRPENPH